MMEQNLSEINIAGTVVKTCPAFLADSQRTK